MKNFLVVNKLNSIIEGVSLAHNVNDLGTLSGHDFYEYNGSMSSADLVGKTYYLAGSVKILPPRPDEMYQWQISTEIWSVNISLLKDKYYNKIRSDLQIFIFETSDFPVWKQVNYSDTGTQLQLKKLSTTLSTIEQSTLDNIVLVRSWKDVLLVERNRVKTLIYAATNLSEITLAFDSMVYSPPPFSL